MPTAVDLQHTFYLEGQTVQRLPRLNARRGRHDATGFVDLAAHLRRLHRAIHNVLLTYPPIGGHALYPTLGPDGLVMPATVPDGTCTCPPCGRLRAAMRAYAFEMEHVLMLYAGAHAFALADGVPYCICQMCLDAREPFSDCARQHDPGRRRRRRQGEPVPATALVTKVVQQAELALVPA